MLNNIVNKGREAVCTDRDLNIKVQQKQNITIDTFMMRFQAQEALLGIQINIYGNFQMSTRSVHAMTKLDRWINN